MLPITSLHLSPSSLRPTEDGAPDARALPHSPAHSRRSFFEANEEASLLLSPAPTRLEFANPFNKDMQSRFAYLRELESLANSPDRNADLFNGSLSTKFSLMATLTPSAVTPARQPGRRSGGCNCRNTKCLRLNCKCFKTLGYCSPDCGCSDCLNRTECADVRDFVVKKTREINRNAFQSKAVTLDTADGGPVLNSQGCSCKTGCQKNYCECFRLGAGCSLICKCLQCRNTMVVLEREQVKDVVQVVRRTKHKIVIGAKGSEALSKHDDGLQAKGFSIAFERYKRVKSHSKNTDTSSNSSL